MAQNMVTLVLGITNILALSCIIGTGIYFLVKIYKGKKFDKWLPLQYMFALALVLPVFNGTSAMQILLANCIDLSVRISAIIA